MIKIEIKQLSEKDFAAARKFAIEGMHLSWYAGTGVALYLYSLYFWYLEIRRATVALGAYWGDELVGVLLVDMDGEAKLYRSLWRTFYVRVFAFILNLVFKNASGTYDTANKELLAAYKNNHTVDGELNFFAVNPDIKGKGIGTKLLNELERRKTRKHIYLYTDSGSTFQFYYHRGFKEAGKKEVELEINKKQVPLTCYLFSKTL